MSALYSSGMPPAPQANDDVCVVVRMLNEEQTVGLVVAELREQFPLVVCVDDGSTDNSAVVAERAGATVVRHPFNLGGGAALQTGFEYVLTLPTVNFVVTFDADGQHVVGDALRLLQISRDSGVDVVLGSRFLAGGSSNVPPLRKLVLRGGTAFTRLTTGVHLTDAHNGLRVLNRRAVGSMRLTLNSMAYASQLVSRITTHNLTYIEAPVTILYTHYSRGRGQSNVNAINIVFDLGVERLRGAR